MTEYEKASLLLQSAVLEFLQIIAWANRNSPIDAKRIEDVPIQLIRTMVKECPEAAKLLATAGGAK